MNSAAPKFGNALRTGEYLPKLKQTQHEAARLGVTGVPTFFIEDRERNAGAQSIEVFRKVLRSGQRRSLLGGFCDNLTLTLIHPCVIINAIQ
jgi:hypothetical protein